MLSITRIFSHNITPKPIVVNRAAKSTIGCDTVSFASKGRIKSFFKKITTWWHDFLSSAKKLTTGTKDARSLEKIRMSRFEKIHSAREFKIAQKRGLFKIHPERALDTDDIEALTALSDKAFSNFKKRDIYSFVIPKSGDWRVCDVRCLARLSDEEFANIAKRGLNSENSPLKKYIRDPYDLAELAELSDKDFSKIEARKLLNPKLYKNTWGNLEGVEISMLAKLPDNIFANLQKRNLTSAKYYGFNGYFDIYQITELAALSDKAFLNIERRGLLNKDFARRHGIFLGRDVRAMAELSNEKFEAAKEFLKKCYCKQYPFVVGKILNELPKEKIQKLQELCNNDKIVELFSDGHGMKLLRKLGIVDLIIDKKVDVKTVESIAEEIQSKSSKLSKEIFSDIKLLTKSKSKSVVVEFIQGTDKKMAFNSSKVGDVVQIGKEMFINDGEKLVQWQMDRKTFDKLFPPIERFMIKQKTNDCYLLTPIFDCMRNPASRAEIYKSFKLDGDDVICTIKAYKDFNGSVRFEKGNLPYDFTYVDACDGVKMLEYAYAKTALRYTPVEISPYLNSNPCLNNRITGGEASHAYHELLGLKNLDYIIKMPKINKKTGRKEVECLIDVQREVLPLPKKFALHNTHLHSEKDWLKILEEYANKDEYLISFSTFKNADDRSLGIIPTHVYSIVGYNSSNRTVKIVNPHNTAVVRELPISELAEYSGKLNIAKIK